MIEEKLGSLYENMANAVLEMIPVEWTKVIGYGEISEGSGTAFFYFYPKNSDSPIYSNDIPKSFGMDEEVHLQLLLQLVDNLRELWLEFKKNGQEPWTNLTFVFDESGKFHVEYSYEDLSDANDYERFVIWRYQHLGIVPDDDYVKKFIDKYLKSIEK